MCVTRTMIGFKYFSLVVTLIGLYYTFVMIVVQHLTFDIYA